MSRATTRATGTLLAACIRAAALVSVAVALWGARVERDTTVAFLLDLPPGTTAGAPLLELGGVAHPALFHAPTAGAGQARATVPASLEIDVPLELPASMAHGAVDVDALVLLGSRSRRLSEIVREPHRSVRVRFEPEDLGAQAHVILLATPRIPPGSRVATLGPVRVPPNAQLDVAFGIDERQCADHPAVDFGVDVLDGTRTWPVLRRRLGRSSCGTWSNVRLALGAFSGRHVRIRLRARAARRAARDRPLAVHWGDPLLRAPRPRDAAPPNVILVSLDTLGARHLGTYGYAVPTSPQFDAWARRGVLFEHAVTHYPSTAGAHMTLFTGRHPTAHGVRSIFDGLPAEVPTLPEVLRNANVMTAAVTENGGLGRSLGFGRGFHAYWENRVAHAEPPPGLARQSFERALGWLRTDPPEPFFLFVHTYEVHGPHRPDPRALQQVHPRGAPSAPDLRALYDGEVRVLDHLLGSFVHELAAMGLLDRTVVIVTSDHGEAFGEHRAWTHGSMLYDEVMHVPLLFLGAGVRPGHRVPTSVGLIDVMPTILELVGRSAPVGLAGRSLVPALRGDRLPQRSLIAEVRGEIGKPAAPEPDLRAVWLPGGRKVIRDVARDRWHVFDLRADPGEQRDLAAEDAGSLRAARTLLGRYERGDDAAAPALAAPEDASVLEKLRVLGYLE